MKEKRFKNTDWIVLLISLALLGIGLVALYSATQNTELDEFKKQIQWALFSIPFIIIVYFVDYKLIVNANIVADDQIYSIIKNRELIKQGRWIYVESSLIYDNSWAWENASDLKLEINLELINNEEEILEEDVEISIQEIQLNLNPRQTYDDLDYHTAKEIMVLDAWTGELKTLENFKYNPSAFIEYINPGVDKTKNKIDLREIEYYSIPDYNN